MKMTLRKIGLLLLCIVVCAGMSSCRRKIEKVREKIRIEEVERAELRGLTGLDIVLRVRNDTGYKLRLDKASLDLFLGTSLVAGMVLAEPVEVGRRTAESVSTHWRLRISDPFAAYALVRRIERNDISAVAVSCAVEGRGGPVPVNISREKVPLSEFLNTFGVELQELKNHIDK